MLRDKYIECLVYACLHVCVLPFKKVGQDLCEINSSVICSHTPFEKV